MVAAVLAGLVLLLFLPATADAVAAGARPHVLDASTRDAPARPATARRASPGPGAVDTTRAATALGDTLRQLAQEAQGRLGVGVELLETGEQVLHDGAGRFPMQSVYKLPVAVATLAAVDRGALALERRVTVMPADHVGPLQHSPLRDAHPTGTVVTVRELLRLSTAESDGSACDVLFRLLGGPARVRGFLQRAGLGEIEVRSTERAIGASHEEQYRNWATPRGALALLRAVQANRVAAHGTGRAGGVRERPLLSDSARTALLGWLTTTPTGPRRLRGLLPAGTVVAHKTGSSRTVAGVTAATNDIGIVTLPDGRHLAVAVFLADSRLDDAARERMIARVARAAWQAHAPAAAPAPRPAGDR